MCIDCYYKVLREMLPIAGTRVFVVHDSSDSPGYQSVLFVALTTNTLPESLRLIRLRVVVEGVVFERDFEADLNVHYRFAWDRRNAYNQKVYGVTTATGTSFTTSVTVSLFIVTTLSILLWHIKSSTRLQTDNRY